MNDEQSRPERMTEGPVPPGLAGVPDQNGSSPGRADPDQAAAGAETAAAVPAATNRRSPRSAWRELPILIVVALAIALVVKSFVVQPFFIPSSSMENTLLIGDKVLVNKIIYHFRSIEPGDIIVFNGIGSLDTAPPPGKPASGPNL